MEDNTKQLGITLLIGAVGGFLGSLVHILYMRNCRCNCGCGCYRDCKCPSCPCPSDCTCRQPSNNS